MAARAGFLADSRWLMTTPAKKYGSSTWLSKFILLSYSRTKRAVKYGCKLSEKN